jgi:hypothetical protein
MTQLNAIPDLVKRYGIQFKEVAQQEAERIRNEEHLQALFMKLSRPEKDKVDMGDMRDVMRLGRITHSCRAPLLFTNLRSSLFFRSGDSFFFSPSSASASASSPAAAQDKQGTDKREKGPRPRSHSSQSIGKGSCKALIRLLFLGPFSLWSERGRGGSAVSFLFFPVLTIAVCFCFFSLIFYFRLVFTVAVCFFEKKKKCLQWRRTT